jgi:hypothetical protein
MQEVTILKEPLYVVDTKNFKGHPQSTMHVPGIVDYTGGKTLEEYSKEKGTEFVAITWDEYDEKYQKPWLKSLQKPFKKISKKTYWYYLECVPPKKFRHIGSFETFFVGECYTATLYEFCFSYIDHKKKEHYFSALRDIYTDQAELLEQMKAKVKIR